MTKHSPTPWRAALPGDTYPHRDEEDSLEICCLPHMAYDALDVFGPRMDRALTWEELTANARLIAAAPDLLEALEELLADFGQMVRDPDLLEMALEMARRGRALDFSDGGPETVQKASAAIAKAKGG